MTGLDWFLVFLLWGATMILLALWTEKIIRSIKDIRK